MTILDVPPLNRPRDPVKERVIGIALIFFPLLGLALYFYLLWGTSQVDWYYVCLIPACIPTGAFFSYWIWLSSQYFRYSALQATGED
jgi:hypothetical protein